MKKRLLSLLIVLVCVISLTGCTVGRKNSAGNLKITKYDKTNNAYTIEYVESKLDFGKFFIIIENESLSKMYCEYNAKKYKLGNSYTTIGGFSTPLDIDDQNGKVTLSLKTPFKFVKSKDGDIEKLNDQSISLYVEFVDVNTPNSGEEMEGLIDSASIKLTTNSEDLLTFIRNKKPKTE